MRFWHGAFFGTHEALLSVKIPPANQVKIHIYDEGVKLLSINLCNILKMKDLKRSSIKSFRLFLFFFWNQIAMRVNLEWLEKTLKPPHVHDIMFPQLRNLPTMSSALNLHDMKLHLTAYSFLTPLI